MITLLAILMVAGCKKKEETPVVETTAEEAVTIMATSLCTGNAGTMTQVDDAVTLSKTTILKSSLYDSSFTITNTPGAVITYQYQMNYSYSFLNSNNFQLTYNATGNYNAPMVYASITTNGSLNVTGILSGNDYIVNGQASREGTFTLKGGNQNSVSATVTTNLINLKVSKATGVVGSGTATIVVNGSTAAGRNFAFTGNLVYTGNYTGTLTIVGKQYYINLTTGTVQ